MRFPTSEEVANNLKTILPPTIPEEGMEVRLCVFGGGDFLMYAGPRPTPLGPSPSGYWGTGTVLPNSSVYSVARGLLANAHDQWARGEHSESNP